MKRIRSFEIGNSRPSFFVALTIVITLLFSLNAAAQNQYYVSTSGSDSNNGTSATTPWRHISKAIASFTLGANGAQINVHAGTYSDENLNCYGFSAAVCITRGGSSPTVRLKIVCDTQWSVPSSTGCLIRNASGNTMVEIQANNVDFGAINQFGFDISHPATSAYGMTGSCDAPTGPGHCSQGNSFHFLGNYLHDMSSQIATCEVNPNGHPGIGPFPNHHGPYVTDLIIKGNRLTEIGPVNISLLNGVSGGGGGGGNGGCLNNYGMYIMGQQAIIQDNILSNIVGYGIHLYSSPCQTVISNNTILRTEFANMIIGGGDCNNGVPAGNVTVSNNILGMTAAEANIITGVGGGSGVGSAGHTVLVSNNIFSGGAGGQVTIIAPNYTTVVNSKTEAPTTTFVSYTGGNNDDFHLKIGSVAIANGTTTCAIGGASPCVPQLDIAATVRPSLPSLGAYEATSSSARAPSAPTGLTAQVQ